MNAQDGSCKPAVETGRVEVIYGGRNDPLDSVKGLAAVADVTLPSDVVLGQIKLSDTMLGPARDDESNRNFDSSTVTFVEQPSFQNKDLTSQTTYTNIHDSGVEPIDHIDDPLPEHHSTTVINPMVGAAVSVAVVDTNQVSLNQLGEIKEKKRNIFKRLFSRRADRS